MVDKNQPENWTEHKPVRTEIPYSPTINTHSPVLLLEGFNFIAAAPGTIAEIQNVIATNRGTVKFIDLYPFIFGGIPSTFDTNVPCTLSAGGQNLLEDFQLGIWDVATQLGKDKRHRIRVMLNEAQTFTSRIDNTANPLIQAYAPHLYYTTKNYETWLKKEFRLKWGLGLKRKTYRLEIPAGLSAADVSLDAILPRQNGNIIALAVESSTALTSLRQCFYDVKIDGIEVVKNVFGLNASNVSGRDSYILPMFIEAGSTFTFRGFGDTSVLPDPVVLNLTFYFEN